MNDIFTVVFENEKSLNAERGRNNDVLLDLNNQVPYLKANCETKYDGQNNTWIILGRDRPAGLDSGYGGKGDEKAGAIDIVVGRLSHIKTTTLQGKKVGNSIGGDAARITLSQKTDVDTNFRIVDGKTGKSIASSAIAIKADDIRIVARRSMKLVTGTDVFLSTGNRVEVNSGIQLIGNNDDKDMQPIPKGTNLLFAINELMEKVLELNGIVSALMEIQKQFNDVVANHVHHFDPLSFPYVTQTAVDTPLPICSTTLPFEGEKASLKMHAKVEQQLLNHTNNLSAFVTRYLLASSKMYINSSYHYLN